MPLFFSAGARRKFLWFASASGAGVLLADWCRLQRDGPDAALFWGHMMSPRWLRSYEDDFHSRRVYTRFFGEPPQAVAEAEEAWGPWKHCPFTRGGGGCPWDDDGIPQDLRTRFMRYAIADPTSGELVLRLPDFVRCMLLLPPSDATTRPFRGPPFMRRRYEEEQRKRAKESEVGGQVLNALSSHVDRRLVGIFEAVDLDRSGNINYAEFVVLFTMLSTRRRTFKMAFELLDDDDNMAVNEQEFTRLMNTLMVDPSVQLVYDAATVPHDKHISARLRAKGVSAADIAPEAARVKPRRIRQNSSNDHFSYTIPSSLVMNLVRSPIPIHDEPPPGSTHHSGEKGPYIRGLEAQLAKDNKAGHISYETFWYRMDFLRWELRAVEFGTVDSTNSGFITLRDFRTILSYDARRRYDRQAKTAAAATATAAAAAAAAVAAGTATADAAKAGATNSHGNKADGRASTEAELSAKASSRPGFWNFGRRYDTKEAYEKQQQESGRREVTSRLRKDALDAAIGYVAEDEPIVSWQFYQTVFDIIRESDRTLPALQVALRSLPPTLSEDLVQGAIPDDETQQRSVEVKELVVQKAEATSDVDKKAIRKSQADLVRPTALTWHQFGRVLGAMDGIPKLTEQDQRLFFALFDADRSGTITPDEFAQLCELKRSFFATSLPRFTEPRRNPVQQFVFCMQQLE